MRPLWFDSPSGKKMYVAAEKDSDGWVIRLLDQNGKSISPIVFRVATEAIENSMAGPLSMEIITDLMHEMRRQVMQREIEFFDDPKS